MSHDWIRYLSQQIDVAGHTTLLVSFREGAIYDLGNIRIHLMGDRGGNRSEVVMREKELEAEVIESRIDSFNTLTSSKISP